MRLNKIIAALSLCTLLFSSCANGNSGEVTSVPEISSGISESVSASEVTENSSEALVSESDTDNAESSLTETEIPPSVSGNIDDTSETGTDISSEQSAVTSAAGTETSAPVQTSHDAPTVTTAKTTASSSATTAAQKPPAEVVIPKINLPKADGTNVISDENSEIDYSNASEGYISAVYTGSSAKAKLRVQCGDMKYDHDLAVGGVREFFPLMGSGNYTVSVYEQFSGTKYAMLASGDFSVNIRSSTDMYLYPNKYIDFDSSSNCVRKAAELCAGLTDDVEKIAAIFTFITDNVVYDKQLAATVQSGYVPHPDATLASKKGICYDYASLFTAMCRSQGIPARLVIGYADPDIYHAWNEVYTDETGWITPELFLKNKGYNIADATFYAGNSDKEKISEYISDDGNYSAVYRY